MKKTILIDLDGVLNDYDGNFSPEHIPNIKTGAKEFLAKLSQQYEIKIFTTRNKILACKWIFDNNLTNYISDITSTKELSWLYIDDRCIKFEGDYNLLTKEIDSFKTWYS